MPDDSVGSIAGISGERVVHEGVVGEPEGLVAGSGSPSTRRRCRYDGSIAKIRYRLCGQNRGPDRQTSVA